MILRLLAKDPDDRYPPPRRSLAHLRRLGGLDPEPARPPATSSVGSRSWPSCASGGARPGQAPAGSRWSTGPPGSGKTALAARSRPRWPPRAGWSCTASASPTTRSRPPRCAAPWTGTPHVATLPDAERERGGGPAAPRRRRRRPAARALSATLAGPARGARPGRARTGTSSSPPRRRRSWPSWPGTAEGCSSSSTTCSGWTRSSRRVLRQLAERLADTRCWWSRPAARRGGRGDGAGAFRAACGDRLDTRPALGPLDDDDVGPAGRGLPGRRGVSPELIPRSRPRSAATRSPCSSTCARWSTPGCVAAAWGTWVLDADAAASGWSCPATCWTWCCPASTAWARTAGGC